MTSKARWMALIVLAGGSLLARAGDGSSSEGMPYRIASRGAVAIVDGHAETFDLEDLADGSSRVFGGGEHTVTVAREGNSVTIRRPAAGTKTPLEVTCDLAQDSCSVLTFADDPERVAVVIQKERHCENGDGDCLWKEEDEQGGEGAVVFLRKTIECEEDGPCIETEDRGSGPAGELSVLRIDSDEPQGHARRVVVLGRPGADGARVVVLRCPEGDTTMRVSTQEAAETWLCPRHSLPLERSRLTAN